MRKISTVCSIVQFVIVLSRHYQCAEIQHTEKRLSPKMCTSSGCVLAAANFLNSIDYSKNPCDNFYEFACGKWIKNHPIPDDKPRTSVFNLIDDTVKEKMRYSLEKGIENTTSKAIKLVQDVYTKCIDTNALEHLKSAPLLDFLNDVGGWPIITPEWKANDKLDITTLMAMALQESGVQLFISLSIYADQKNTNNTIITVDQGALGLGPGTRNYYLNETAFNKQISAYKEKIYGYAKLITSDQKRHISDDVLQSNIDRMLAFEEKFAQINVPEEDRRNVTATYNKLTLQELNNVLNFIDWDKYLSLIMPNEVYHRLIKGNMDKYDVIVTSPKFIKDLNQLLRSSDKKDIVNFIVWKAVDALAKFQDIRYEDNDQKFQKAFTGREQKPLRWKTCLDIAHTLHMAFGAIFVQQHFNKANKIETLNLIRDIKQVFEENLHDLDWMNDKTKIVAKAKAEYMINNAAYPDFLLNDSALDKYYDNLTIVGNQTLYRLMTTIKCWYTNQSFFDLLTAFDRYRVDKSPAVVNAFYTRPANSLMILAAILQPPIFDASYPKYKRYVNYGSMGVVIGHELTHGFDDQGAKYDKFGNLNNWWDETSLANFQNKTKCIREQYSNYVVPDIKTKVNGKLTQGEDIADNGGLKQAFLAYQKHVKMLGMDEPQLPSLNLTNEQVLFVSFANVWCSNIKPSFQTFQILTDVHSPPMFRAIGPVSNFPAFAAAFNCPHNSLMNPEQKCGIW